MAGEKDDKGKAKKADEELTPVGPGAELESSAEDEEQPREARDESEEAPEREDEEERVGHADESDEDRDGKRESRREQRKRKKERYRRDQLELRFLRTRNEALERRFSDVETRQAQGEVVTIDGRIGQVEEQIRQADEIYSKAVEKGDGESATEARNIRDNLRDGLKQLQEAKRQAIEGERQRRTAPEQRVDPEIRARAEDWAADHEWYDPQLRDEDSFLAKAIETRLANDGRFDPRSDEYWQELDRRLKKRLPEKYAARRGDDREDDEMDDEEESGGERRKGGNGKAAGGPTFRTGGRERSLKRGEVYISAERRRALEESGAWEDPILREKYLRSYQRYDKEHGRRH